MVDQNTRKEKRTPVTLKIKFKSATLDQFIERYSVDVSQGGIFIRTKDPLAVGTQLRFEFQLQDASPLISGDGTVVWTREHDPGRVGVAPGMGVRFDRLAADSQHVLTKILSQKKDGEGAFDAGQQNHGATRVAAAALPATKPPNLRPRPLVPPPATPRAKLEPAPAAERATPKPMPFHDAAGDDFSGDVFEQPTRVASLDAMLDSSAAPAHSSSQVRTVVANSITPEVNAILKGGEEPRLPHMSEARTIPSGRIPDEIRKSGASRADSTPHVPTEVVDVDVDDRKTVNAKLQSLAARGGGGSTGLARRGAEGPLFDNPADPQATTRQIDASKVAPALTHEPRLLRDSDEQIAASESGIDIPIGRAGAPTPVPGKRRRSSMPILVAGALVALGAAAYVMLFTGGDDAASAQERRPTVTQAGAAGPAKADTPPAPPATAVKPPPVAQPVVQAPKITRVELTSTPPGADVEIDGAAAGRTPLTIQVTDEAPVAARVSLDCFEPKTVTIAAGQTRPIAVELEAMPRFLEVDTPVWGATVVLDGRVIGTTPKVKLPSSFDPAKPHTVSIRKVGYETAETSLDAGAVCEIKDDQATLTVQLAMAAKAAPVPVRVTRPVRRPPPRRGTDAPPVIEERTTLPPAEEKQPEEKQPVEIKEDKKEPAADCDPSPDAPDWARCK